ncbi:hypothetical protein BH10PSE2_BH10PSE2_01400 [soil metagenome]
MARAMTDTAPRRHSRAGLYAPFILVGIALAAWTGWWFYLASQVQGQVAAQAAALRSSGWTVAYGKPSLSGWPFRLRAQADAVSLKAPSGHALAMPVLVAQAGAWNPAKWVLLATDGLTVTRAGKGDVLITGQAIRMSIHGLTQRWPNVAIELARPVFTPRPGAEAFPIARAELVQLYLRPHLAPAGTPGVETSVDMLFRLVDADGRPDGPVQGMAQNGRLSAQIETVVERADQLTGADAAGIFAAWTRAGGRFTHVRGELKVGDGAAQSTATLSSERLSAQADGRLQGQIALKAVRPLPAIAGLARSGSGSVNRLGAGAAAAGVAASSVLPGSPGENLDLTLVFRDGRTFLGPFALAPAPKLF